MADSKNKCGVFARIPNYLLLKKNDARVCEPGSRWINFHMFVTPARDMTVN